MTTPHTTTAPVFQPTTAPGTARVLEAYVEPIYRRWAEQLLGDAGFHLGTFPLGEDDAAFVFDGAGDGALRILVDRSWPQNTRTVVYTLHAHPIWHAALAGTGAHVVPWPEATAGIARALGRARRAEVRQLPAAPIKGMPARVAGLLLTGYSGAAAADRLGANVKTINSHAQTIMAAAEVHGEVMSQRRTAALLKIANTYYSGAEL